jgi:hypothetical protein
LFDLIDIKEWNSDKDRQFLMDPNETRVELQGINDRLIDTQKYLSDISPQEQKEKITTKNSQIKIRKDVRFSTRIVLVLSMKFSRRQETSLPKAEPICFTNSLEQSSDEPYVATGLQTIERVKSTKVIK